MKESNTLKSKKTQNAKKSCKHKVAREVKEYLGSDEQNLAVQNEHTAVVADSLVKNWHANVADDAIGEVAAQEGFNGLPGWCMGEATQSKARQCKE